MQMKNAIISTKSSITIPLRLLCNIIGFINTIHTLGLNCLGSCNPRYMRSTMYTVPCSHDLLNSIKVPLGLIIQPMASVKSNEVCTATHLYIYTLALCT